MQVFIVGLLGLATLASSVPLSKDTQTKLSLLLADNSDAFLTVPELIEKYGYPVEIHNITTEDGYILQAHRIPYGQKCGPGAGKRVILLQHGLLGDSSNWVVSGTEKGLAYNLADECYDVWMGNYRGNTYSRNHISLHPGNDKEQFWGFSWNEMGLYDIPAEIDYILNKTGEEAIYFVGHSMGTTGFWVTMSERPEYNSKIKLMSAFAPIAYTQNMITPLRLLAPYLNEIEWLMKMTGLYEFLPSNELMDFLGQTLCHQNSSMNIICDNILFLIAGYDADQLDQDLLPTILGHSPAGSSSRAVLHYAQGVSSGTFRKYDFGQEQNLVEYGSLVPPAYNLSKVTAPVAFYWAENDWLAAKADTQRLSEGIQNLKRTYRVNHDQYNHLDFLWAKDNIELINKPAIEFMKDF